MELPQLSDQELVQMLASGNEQAFTEIFNRYWPKLYFLAHSHFKSATAAEEVTQNVFLQLWVKKETVQIQSLPQYLAAMTRYAVYRQLAHSKKMPQSMLFESLGTENKTDEEEQAIESRLMIEMVEKLSGRLPEKCRLVFIQNKLLDQPLPQVAQQLNISLKTAESHLTKALKVLRRNFGGSFILVGFTGFFL